MRRCSTRRWQSAFEAACERLRDAGVALEDVDIPHANDVAAIYVHIVLAEAAAYHAKTLESRSDDYTTNVRLRLEMGRYILAEDYVRALRGRDLLRREVDAALAGRDALLLPALAVPAHEARCRHRYASAEPTSRSATSRCG